MYAAQRFPGEPRSASLARRFVTGVLTDCGRADAADVAALLVTELVTNAVLHAGSDVEVSVDAPAGDHIRVEVFDESPVAPSPRRHSLTAATGRGLQLVAELARAWGVDPVPDGKRIWFTLTENAADPTPNLDGWLTYDEMQAWA